MHRLALAVTTVTQFKVLNVQHYRFASGMHWRVLALSAELSTFKPQAQCRPPNNCHGKCSQPDYSLYHQMLIPLILGNLRC